MKITISKSNIKNFNLSDYDYNLFNAKQLVSFAREGTVLDTLNYNNSNSNFKILNKDASTSTSKETTNSTPMSFLSGIYFSKLNNQTNLRNNNGYVSKMLHGSSFADAFANYESFKFPNSVDVNYAYDLDTNLFNPLLIRYKYNADDNEDDIEYNAAESEFDISKIPGAEARVIVVNKNNDGVRTEQEHPVRILMNGAFLYGDTPSWGKKTNYNSKTKEGRALFYNDIKKSAKKFGVSDAVANYIAARSALESRYGEAPSGNYNFGNITIGVLNYDGSKYDKNKGTKYLLDGSASNSFKHYVSMDEYVKDSIAYLKRKWKVDTDRDDFETILNKTRHWSEADINNQIRSNYKHNKS